MTMALRLFYYQGVLQARAAEEAEDQGLGPSAYNAPQGAPQINSTGVDMRHNMAAAKAAAKGLKGANAEQVSVVPIEAWLAAAPEGTATVTKV